MNILSIAVACLLVYYLYKGSRPLKRQKGGNKGVVIVLVVLLLAGGGVAAYFLLKNDSSPSPSPVVLRNYETRVRELCGKPSPSPPATMEWTGEICPDGQNIQWNSMKTNGYQPPHCHWSRSNEGKDPTWLSTWMGGCNVRPTNPGLSDLPMTVSAVNNYSSG